MAKFTSQAFMEIGLNEAPALTMHIDMNSCYATLEQQNNPNLRGRPVGVCAYATWWGAIISPSIEAKQAGVKVGMSVRDAQKLCPNIAVIQMYPPLYHDAHMRFKHIFMDYVDLKNVWVKSIDEVALNLDGSVALQHMTMEEVGREIKQRVREDIGEWVRVNVGIAPNQFLAKLAASFNKPDGLTTIDHNNLADVYKDLDLLDLPGINIRNKMRLWLNEIYTPLEFLEASLWDLRRVFAPQKLNGFKWYVRLKGYEVDDKGGKRRSYGNNNTLQIRTNDWEVLKKFVMKLCEKTGRRMRAGGYEARRIHVFVVYQDGHWWHQGMKTGGSMYTTFEIFHYAMKLFSHQPFPENVPTHLGIDVSDLVPLHPEQTGVFDKEFGEGYEYGKGELGDVNKAISRSLDAINDKYGDLVVGSALLEGMDNFILNRIAFGSVKDVQDLYEN